MKERKQRKKVLGKILAAAAAVMIAAGFSSQEDKVWAAESTVIENISVKFQTTYGDAEEIPDPEITVSGDCSLGEIIFNTDYDRWKPGRKVRTEITVYAEEGKIFPTSLTRSQCKVSGADFVSAKAMDDTTLQVKADYTPVTVLGQTEKAGWSSSGKRAVWEKVEYAPGYSLVLYGDDKVVKRLTVEANNVDLSDYMTDPDKTYYYEVKAIPVTSDERKYLKEGGFVTSTEQDMDWYLEENTDDGGSLKGDNYVFPDGSRQVNVWKKISGSWYYFDENGTMAAGWHMVGSRWYYFNSDGQMQTGWIQVDGVWYYLDPDGAMKDGWTETEPGIWYYLNPVSDGTRGAMETGWKQINGNWYYLNPVSDGTKGQMKTGWVQTDGKWYYLYSDGHMAANTTIDGWTVGPDGAWVS